MAFVASPFQAAVCTLLRKALDLVPLRFSFEGHLASAGDHFAGWGWELGLSRIQALEVKLVLEVSFGSSQFPRRQSFA